MRISIPEMYAIAEAGKIKTHSGTIDVFNPDPDDINIVDIAHALSFHCSRWLQAGFKFYPVAKHCIEAAQFASDERKLEALLHDASEAYLYDIPSPIKKKLPDYQNLEDTLMKAIANKFGFQYPLSKHVKEIDKMLLETEWKEYVMENIVIINKPNYYKSNFLKLYEQITGR